MIEPAKLLKDFGVSGIVSDNALVCVFSAGMLDGDRYPSHDQSRQKCGLTSFCCS